MFLRLSSFETHRTAHNELDRDRDQAPDHFAHLFDPKREDKLDEKFAKR